MVRVRRAGWEGVREEPALLRLSNIDRPQSGGYGRERCATRRVLIGPAGTTSGRVWTLPPGGHGECPRRSHDDAAGTKWGSSPVERISVNVGTVPVLTPFPCGRHGAGVGFTVDRSGRSGAEPP